MRLFNVGELESITGGRLLQPGSQPQVSGVTIDSRNVKTGDLFVAFPGERHDGHEYVLAAAQAGAVGAMVTRAVEAPESVFLLQVDDARSAIAALAGHHRMRFNIPVVGVTGSVGKTTTKEMVAAVLGQRWKTLKSEGNFNNELGLPLTLFRLDEGYEAAVLEMGMRGAGQIASLAGIAHPTAGVITNVGETHIEILGSVAAIAAAKGELAEALPPEGLLALNADDPYVVAMASRARAKTLFFGRESRHHAADLWASEVETMGLEGIRFRLCGAMEGLIRVPLPGEHNVLNALGAITVAWGLGLTKEQISGGLMAYQAAPHRLILLRGAEGQHVIDDTYNANPASMRATLRLLGETPCAGRRIAILGDMLELGSRANEAHREAGAAAREAGVDLLIAFGPLSGYVAEGARSAGLDPSHVFAMQHKEQVFERVLELTGRDDVVLVKGSRGMRMEEVVDVIVKGKSG